MFGPKKSGNPAENGKVHMYISKVNPMSDAFTDCQCFPFASQNVASKNGNETN
jgi:hypothetical protein